MSNTAQGYRDGVALWAAATDKAKTAAEARGANSGVLLRQLVNDRFLARVFHPPRTPWVLKGGTAVPARVDDARTTKDVDLLGELDDIDVALERLRSTAAVDLDHFRFIITRHDKIVLGTGQPPRRRVPRARRRVLRSGEAPHVRCRPREGSLMTTAPDVQTPPRH